MHERIHEGQKCSLKANIAEGDTRSQGPRNKTQALRKTTCLNHGNCEGKTLGNADMVPHVNSTLTGSARVWFDDLPPESIDSYDDLKKTFLENFLQQKKCIKDLVEIYHIKQREGESTEDFVQRFKTESRHAKRASKGEVAASNQAWKKALLAWKQQEARRRQNFDKRATSRTSKGAKIGQRKRPTEGGKEGSSFREGQIYGDPNGPAMAKGGQAKDHTRLLLQFINLVPTARR
ncbi:reverse transcriptase domain-containing protein [Tanacetum coccineum]